MQQSAAAAKRGERLTLAATSMPKSCVALHKFCIDEITFEKMTGTAALRSSWLKPTPYKICTRGAQCHAEDEVKMRATSVERAPSAPQMLDLPSFA